MHRHEAPTGLEIAGLVGALALAVVAVASLALAELGAHDGVTALAIGVAVAIAFVAVVVRRRRDWSVAPWSWPPAVALALVLVVAAAQFFPGFPLAAKIRDPGVYVNHAVAIARQGSVVLDDPVFATGAEVVVDDGEARIVTDEGDVAWRKLPYRAFPTDPDDPEHLLPDFFHLWPASLATAYDLGGRTGLFNLTPLLALGAVALLFLATRRAFGLVAATVASVLLAVNELQVWQAKFPTAEALSEFLYTGALLALVVALRTRWRPAAAIAGGLVGVGFLARPEGIVVVGLAAIGLALLWAVDRIDGRAVAFAIGLAPPLLFATYEAYGRGSRYAAAQEGLPSFAQAVAGAVLLFAAAVALRLLLARGPAVVDRVRALDTERMLRVIGYSLVGLFALFLAVAWFRGRLFGANYRINKAGDRTRGYDELNLRRLAIFLTPVALVAAVGALAVGVRQRWDAARWLLVLPGLVIAPVLIWEPHIAPDLMWWGRRYLPMVVPTLLVLVGVAVGLLWERRGSAQTWVRVGTAVVVLVLGAYMVRQSTDLWGHEEFGGSLDVIDQLDAVADGEDVAFVWYPGSTQVTNFAMTPFTWLGLPGLTGSPRPTPEGLLALQRALGDRPVYLVSDGDEPPPGTGSVLEAEAHIVTELGEFEHSYESRPRKNRPIPVDLTVWRLVG
jgi:hypothetical protein